jgi:transmembrane sensor
MGDSERPNQDPPRATLAREIDRVREKVAPAWTNLRAKAVEHALSQRLRVLDRRRRQLQAVAVLAAAIVVLGLVGRWAWGPAAPVVAPRGTIASAAPLVLADGSTITADPGSDVRWTDMGPELVSVSLRSGRARFDVAHVEGRVFRVEAGPIAVQVIGTVFVVERVNDRQSRVSVERGRVRVLWADGTHDLGMGEAGVFPPIESSRAASAPTSSSPSPALTVPGAVAEPSASPRRAAPSVGPPGTWRDLAQGGAFEEAYVALKREGGNGAVRDEVNDLLLAADVARLSHHAADAVEPLRKIVRQHSDDPRAPLAAFTQGRVLLESLGLPREAADAFAQARTLAPGGDLAADALAREVEARATAGDTTAARALAEEYVKRYPDGSRLRSVRHHGGLE